MSKFLSQSFCSLDPVIPLFSLSPLLSSLWSLTKLKSPAIVLYPLSYRVSFPSSFIHFLLSLAIVGAYIPQIFSGLSSIVFSFSRIHLPSSSFPSSEMTSISSISTRHFFTPIIIPFRPLAFFLSWSERKNINNWS